MEYRNPEALISSRWLVKSLKRPDIAIVDASFHMPGVKRNPEKEFLSGHVPGAVFFDIDKIANIDSQLPHMLPSPNQFSAHMQKLGIKNDQHVICYDSNGGPMAAMRAWWTFRIFGHEKVSVLDGGLIKWKNDGLDTSSAYRQPDQSNYFAKFNQKLVKTLDQLSANINSEQFQLVDARSEGRFQGIEPEPRTDLRSGHIPKAFNLPFIRLFDPQNSMVMRNADEISKILKSAGVDVTKPSVSCCGSGVTAAAIAFAFYLLGHEETAIYDGSWTEWGGKSDTPID